MIRSSAISRTRFLLYSEWSHFTLKLGAIKSRQRNFKHFHERERFFSSSTRSWGQSNFTLKYFHDLFPSHQAECFYLPPCRLVMWCSGLAATAGGLTFSSDRKTFRLSKLATFWGSFDIVLLLQSARWMSGRPKSTCEWRRLSEA